jgi:hypothetical protein
MERAEHTFMPPTVRSIVPMSGPGSDPLAWPNDGQMCGGAGLDLYLACAPAVPRRLPTLQRRTPREPRPLCDCGVIDPALLSPKACYTKGSAVSATPVITPQSHRGEPRPSRRWMRLR